MEAWYDTLMTIPEVLVCNNIKHEHCTLCSTHHYTMHSISLEFTLVTTKQLCYQQNDSFAEVGTIYESQIRFMVIQRLCH